MKKRRKPRRTIDEGLKTMFRNGESSQGSINRPRKAQVILLVIFQGVSMSIIFKLKKIYFSKRNSACLLENNFLLTTLTPGLCGWLHQYSSCLTLYTGSPFATQDSTVLMMSITEITFTKMINISFLYFIVYNKIMQGRAYSISLILYWICETDSILTPAFLLHNSFLLQFKVNSFLSSIS